jgi:hypothetical protein
MQKKEPLYDLKITAVVTNSEAPILKAAALPKQLLFLTKRKMS